MKILQLYYKFNTNVYFFSLLSTDVKMKLIVQSVLYCCVLTTVAHCTELDVNPELKKRYVPQSKSSNWILNIVKEINLLSRPHLDLQVLPPLLG